MAQLPMYEILWSFSHLISILGHHDWISSVALCKAQHWYLVTGSRDGVIKIWL